MGGRVRFYAVLSVVFLFSLITGFLLYVPVAFSQTHTETVTYDYYVVAGYHMTPTVPSPASSPSGFNFTANPAVYNFGNLTKVPGKDYLYEGTVVTPTGSAFVNVNITNLVGYDIVITNLTAEVTEGTNASHWYFPPAEVWFGNYSLVQLDVFDPWCDDTPPEFRDDEVDYTEGEVIKVVQDCDWWTKAIGIPYPRGEFELGPASLAQPDLLGDAATTGHVTPISLANGATLDEYFGLIIFGDLDEGTQINATITLALTYEYTIPGSPSASFTHDPTAPQVDTVVQFDASASTPNGGDLTDPASYVWEFGDGTAGLGQFVNHTYTAAGSYTVLLNVTDSEGQWDTQSQTITVVAPPVDIPWLWVAIAAVVIILLLVAAVVFLKRR